MSHRTSCIIASLVGTVASIRNPTPCQLPTSAYYTQACSKVPSISEGCHLHQLPDDVRPAVVTKSSGFSTRKECSICNETPTTTVFVSFGDINITRQTSLFLILFVRKNLQDSRCSSPSRRHTNNSCVLK
jgi:hypothetical protein